HGKEPLTYAGAPVEGARCVMIAVHGRNAAPRNILDLVASLDRPDMAVVAPAAAGGSWYPQSFVAPREVNEPGISSGLAMLESVVHDLLARGVDSRRVILLGFSQGACLSSEFALRHPRRYGGVMVLSGGLIGAPGTSWDDVTADFGGTPV